MNNIPIVKIASFNLSDNHILVFECNVTIVGIICSLLYVKRVYFPYCLWFIALFLCLLLMFPKSGLYGGNCIGTDSYHFGVQLSHMLRVTCEN